MWRRVTRYGEMLNGPATGEAVAELIAERSGQDRGPRALRSGTARAARGGCRAGGGLTPKSHQSRDLPGSRKCRARARGQAGRHAAHRARAGVRHPRLRRRPRCSSPTRSCGRSTTRWSIWTRRARSIRASPPAGSSPTRARRSPSSCREGVNFHDGSPFNAEVVRWTVERHLADTTASPTSWMLGPIAGTEVIDDMTIAYHYSDPFVPLLGGARLFLLRAHQQGRVSRRRAMPSAATQAARGPSSSCAGTRTRASSLCATTSTTGPRPGTATRGTPTSSASSMW